MSSRFIKESNALNLKKFHSDNAFLGEPVYAPLNRGNVMSKVVNIIGDHIPEVSAIDFSDNGIRGLDHFASLVQKAPNVKILYLADNKVGMIQNGYNLIYM